MIDQDEELVTPKPADQPCLETCADEISHPQRHLQPLSDLPQQLIACLVTQGVIHRLESIKVEKQHRAAALLLVAYPAQSLLEPLHEHRPVGQSGQAILLRELDQN